MELFGYVVPLWAFFLIGLVGVVVVWKLIKFALKIFLILVLFLVILMGFFFGDDED